MGVVVLQQKRNKFSFFFFTWRNSRLNKKQKIPPLLTSFYLIFRIVECINLICFIWRSTRQSARVYSISKGSRWFPHTKNSNKTWSIVKKFAFDYSPAPWKADAAEVIQSFFDAHNRTLETWKNKRIPANEWREYNTRKERERQINVDAAFSIKIPTLGMMKEQFDMLTNANRLIGYI